MKIKLILLVTTIACFLASCSKEPIVEIQTSMGTIKVKLYNDTPKHRDNFVKLAKDGFYEGVLFHRVIRDFMVQAGDPNSVNAPAGVPLGSGDPGYTIPAEILPNHFHKKGVLSAARKGDPVNPERESSGSQFYIVQGQVWNDASLDELQKKTGITYSAEQREAYKTVGGTPHLDGAYTVFGEVIEGLDVVDAIAAVETAQGDRPVSDVKIIKVTIVE